MILNHVNYKHRFFNIILFKTITFIRVPMDKYKIYYRCYKQPKPNSDLSGFIIEKIYEGRSFNGLFEVNTQWGKGKDSKLIDKSIFNQYFEIISNH